MSSTRSGEVTQPAAAPAAPGPTEDVRWVKCPQDNSLIYSKRLERNLRVCPECNYHFRLSARERLKYLVKLLNQQIT